MKIILSRKGFDSGSGGFPNPILPDGTLLSLPIPRRDDKIKYIDLEYNDRTLYDYLIELDVKKYISNNKWHELNKDTRCHLDPDLFKQFCKRLNSWKPAFGQKKQSQTHLENNNIQANDMFLFFGWFKKTIIDNKKIKFDEQSPDLHIIYGYLQIEKMIYEKELVPNWLKCHPHFKYMYSSESKNCIYVSRDFLTFNKDIKGAGHFKFNDSLVLTKEGCKRSYWKLPESFKDLHITYHNENSWKDGYFKSADRGQEFVIEESDIIEKWAIEIIEKNI